MKPMQDNVASFLESIRIANAGTKVTLTATLKGPTSALLMPMLMLFGARSARASPPPAAVDQAMPEPGRVPR